MSTKKEGNTSSFQSILGKWKKQEPLQKTGIYIVAIMVIGIVAYSIIAMVMSNINNECSFSMCKSRLDIDANLIFNSIIETRSFLNSNIPKGYYVLTCEYILNEKREREVFYVKEQKS